MGGRGCAPESGRAGVPLPAPGAAGLGSISGPLWNLKLLRKYLSPDLYPDRFLTIPSENKCLGGNISLPFLSFNGVPPAVPRSRRSAVGRCQRLNFGVLGPSPRAGPAAPGPGPAALLSRGKSPEKEDGRTPE